MTAPPEKSGGDQRIEATEKIWKHGVLMLLVSLPLAFISKLVFLPVYVVFLTALATLGVWMFGGRQTPSKREKLLEARLNELEERLANLETITRVEIQLGSGQGRPAGDTDAGAPASRRGDSPAPEGGLP